MPRNLLLIDACVAINICATEQLRHIALTLQTTFMMVSQAADEAGELRDNIDGKIVVRKIQLASYDQTDMQITDLRESEYAAFVELAKLVDDGEAATIATAQMRGLALATDDRKARSVCAKFAVPEPTRTLDILRRYACKAGLNDVEIRAMLMKVRRWASYLPGQSDPNFGWWTEHIDQPEDQ